MTPSDAWDVVLRAVQIMVDEKRLSQHVALVILRSITGPRDHIDRDPLTVSYHCPQLTDEQETRLHALVKSESASLILVRRRLVPRPKID